MAVEVRFYIPSVDKEGVPLSSSVRQCLVNDTVSRFGLWYGGCTLTEGHGAWLDALGKLVTEHVTIASAYTGEKEYVERMTELLEWAVWVRDYAHQECVLYSVQPVSEVHFV